METSGSGSISGDTFRAGVAVMLRLIAAIAFTAALCMALFVLPSDAATVGPVDITGLHSIGRTELLSMLGIGPGRPVDEEIIRTGIKRAFLKGIFEDISVKVSEGDPASVLIAVKERDVIENIFISGRYELFENDVRRLFLMKEHGVMRYDLLDSAAERLREEYGLAGYPDAKVDIRVERTERPYRVDLRLDIEAGGPLVVSKIRITGTSENLKGVMKFTEGEILDRNRLDEDIKGMRDEMKRLGYVRPTVGPYSLKDGIVEIPVDPGIRLSISFEGNAELSTVRLLRETPFYEMEELGDEVVGEAIARMTALYHSEGFPSVRIAPVITKDDADVKLRFFVYEGNRVRVRSIAFSGVTLPEDQIRKVLLLQEGDVFNPDLTDRDRTTLGDYYEALGYPGAVVKDVETVFNIGEGSVDIVFEIEEGRPMKIGRVDIIASPDAMDDLVSVLGVSEGAPYNEVDISDGRFRIIDYFHGRGYAGVDVLVERKVEDNTVSLVYKVVEGDKRFFGRTVVIGNRKTKYEVIARELPYGEDRPFSVQTLTEVRRRLYRLGLFSDVDIEPVDAGPNTKDILIRTTEGSAGSIEFGVGYAEYEQFRGLVELSYRNLWGMNRQGLVRTEVSSLQRRVLFQYYEPWFAGVPLPFRTYLVQENRREINLSDNETRYRLERSTFSAGFEKKFSDYTKADIYYEFSLVNTYDVQPDVVLTKEDTGTLAISALKPSVIYDTRDNPFDPRKGIFAGITLKVASGVLLSETSFAKAELYGSAFRALSKRMTLAVSVRGGLARATGTTQELPLVERFFLGGRSSVRGYDQDSLGPKGADGNPTGGNAYIMGNVEVRTTVGRGFNLATFLDTGNVWIRSADVSVFDLKYTAGVGLRYNTPVGPLRLDYGMKLKREPGESRGELHFSIGHAF